MKLSIIVAMAESGVIGRDNALPWRLRADLARFKRLTMGHHLLMGRKTWESIGRPLPGRTMVVITRRAGFSADGIRVAGSIDEALEIARRAGETEAFVAGGAQIYRQMLERADRIYMTRIHAEIEGDTFFPEIDASRWREVAREDHEPDDRSPYRFSFIDYELAGMDRRPNAT
jgi:dihydrofolate reductase